MKDAVGKDLKLGQCVALALPSEIEEAYQNHSRNWNWDWECVDA